MVVLKCIYPRRNAKITLVYEIFFLYIVSCFVIFPPISGHANSPLPSGPAVTHGSVVHDVVGKTMNITQTTSKAIVQYNTFGIGAGHGVLINQPSSSSALLARVTGADRSVIDGLLRATGQVYISNPNGVIFGPSATIDVAALLATTLNIADSDFLTGGLRFHGDSQAAIENQSKNISGDQFVALLAQKIENVGNIQANHVVGAAASEVVVDNVYGGTISVDISGLLGSVNNHGDLNASAQQEGVSCGSIVIKGDRVTHSGTATASATGNFDGGHIEFHGEQEVIIETNSVMEVKGGDGFVRVSSGKDGATLLQGTIDASGKDTDQKGGEVHMLGDRVGILDEAAIDVSGSSGGGTVFVGGDYQGSNPEIQNASRTYISPEGSIKADAIKSGDGGEVIVWSEESTGFYGDISARGGTESGNGGFVEISGKTALDYDGSVNVLAPKGDNGTVLFDPSSGVISNADGAEGAGVNPGEVLFTDITIDEPWNVTPDQLNTVGGDVVLQFNDDLTVEDDVDLTTPGAAFTAQAGDDITINARISTNDGAISLTANHAGGSEAADDGDPGTITMANGTEINAGNQSITLNALGDISLATLSTTGDVNIVSTSGSVADANGAAINVSADSMTVEVDGGINLDTSIVNLIASITGAGNLDITETNSITLTDVDTANGAVSLVADGTITATDVQSTTDSDGNDIVLTSTGGGIEVGLINAGITQGDVSLDAQGGSITDDGDDTVDVIADVLSADAMSGIDVETTIGSIDGSTNGTGEIVLTETDGITLADIDTADGSVTVIAGNTVIATDVASLTDADGNDITITSAAGGIEVGLIDAGTTEGDVILDAQGGSISDDGDALVDIVADTLSASGVNGIDVDTTVVSVNTSTSGVGNIDLTETDGITLTDIETNDGSITVTAGGAITAVDVIADGTGDIELSTSSGDILIDTLVADGDQITINAANSVQEVVLDPDIDLTTDTLAITAVNGIGDTNATVSDDEGLEIQVNVFNSFNSSANNIEVVNTGDLMLDNALAVNADGESILNTGGDVIIRAASNLTILSPQAGTAIFNSADETVDIQADLTATSGNIGIRADDDGSGSGDIIHRAGVIDASAGGILMSAVNVNLDVADDTLLAGGLSAGGLFSTTTPPNSDFGISILASDDIVINEGLTTITGSIILQSDADLTDPLLLTSWPIPLTNAAGPSPDGIGAITFNTDGDVGVDTTGAEFQSGGAITLFSADDITVDQTGMAFTAEATIARAGVSTELHSDAGFVIYSAENIDLNAADGSTTTIDTQAGSGLILITAGFDFSTTNFDAADQQGFGVTNVAGNTAITTDLDNTSLLSGSGVELSQSGDIIVDSISADWIHLESTLGSIEVMTDADLTAEMADPNGSHGGFAIQLDAATALTINSNAVLGANRDDDTDIGRIGLGAGSTITLSGNIGGDAGNATAVEADSIAIGADIALNQPANVVVNNGGILSAENDIMIQANSIVATDGIHLDNVEFVSINGNIVINADMNGTDEGIFEMTGDSRIVADVDNSAAGSLSITADSISITSETTAADSLEINSGSTVNIISDEGIVIGAAGTASTDINSVAAEINFNANNGTITQSDGTIVAAEKISLNASGDFMQSADAGGGVIDDAMRGSSVMITATGDVDIGSNAPDDAIEATGADGIIIQSNGNSISVTGSGDIEASGAGDVDIDATDDTEGDITFSGTGDVITTGSGSIFVDSGLGRTISQQGSDALIDSGGSTNIGQTRLPSTVGIGGNGITSDEAILIDASGAVNIENDAMLATRNVNQNIGITSTGGPLNLQDGAVINATGDLTLTATSITLNSDSGNPEIVAEGAIDIAGTSSDVIIGTAGGGSPATDLQAGGNVTIDAVGDVIQNDGSINTTGSLAIGADGTTENFVQGPDAGDDAFVDAINAETVSIRATSGITIASNSSDDAIESTGVNGGVGVLLTTTAGDISLAGEGDIESSTAANSGVSINTTGSFDMNSSGDIIASGPGDSDVDIATTGNITLAGSGGIQTTGSGDGDVRLEAGTTGSLIIDANNLGAFIDADDGIEIGQAGVGSSTVTIGGDLTADNTIAIDATGIITINENGTIQTTGDNFSEGSITITSTNGQINLSNTARMIANPEDLDNSADITLIADSILLNSANATEIHAAGEINLTTDNGTMGIQADLEAGKSVLLSVIGGGDDADIEIIGGLNTANITAEDFIDMRALDDIEIDQSTLTTTTSSIYLRANDDGTASNDTGDSDLFAGGNVVIGTQGASGDVVFDVNGTGSDSVVWIAGENIFIENQVVANIDGGEEIDSSPVNPLTGNSIPFSFALLASENVGTPANPIQLTGSVKGTVFTLADADLSEVDGGPFAGPNDTPSGTFSHGTGNAGGHLEFNGDLETPNGNGTISLDPGTDIASGGDIVVVASEDIVQNSNLIANGDILLVSTDNNVVINDNITLIAGSDPDEPTGHITLNAEMDIVIGEGVTIRSGENNGTGDINLIADAAGVDGPGSDDVVSIGSESFIMANGGTVNITAPNGNITVDSNTLIIAEQDVTLTAESTIDVDGTLAPGGLLDIESGESGNGDGEGSFRLGANGTIDVNTSLIFGASDGINSSVRIEREASGPADLLTIEGTIDSLGDIIFDLDGLDSGGLDLDTSVVFSGTLNANGKIAVFTQNNQAITGGGTLNAQQIFVVVDGSGDISLGSITADDWIRLDSASGNITIGGPINVGANRGTDMLATPITDSPTITVADATEFSIGEVIDVGVDTGVLITDINYDTNTITQAGNWTPATPQGTEVAVSESSQTNAFELTTSGNVVINGNLLANSNPALNVAVDPSSVTLNADLDISGDIDVHATDDIFVNAVLQSIGGRIVLRADDDGSALPGSAGADGVGDLTMTSGSALIANNGFIDVSGENIVLSDVTAGSTVTVTTDAGGNDGDNQSVTLTSDISGQKGITITDGGVNELDVILQNDVTLTAVDSPVVINTAGLNGNFALDINAGTGENADVTLGVIGNENPVESLTISAGRDGVGNAGTTTLNGSITTTGNLRFSGAADVDLGADTVLTSTLGDILLNGGDVNGSQIMTLVANQGTVNLDTIGVDLTGLIVSAAESALLNGDITIASGNIDFSGSRAVDVQRDVVLSSNGSDIDLGSTNNTDVTGSFTLTLNAGDTGNLFFNNVNVESLSVGSGNTATLNGNIEVNGTDLSFANLADGNTIILNADSSIVTGGGEFVMTNEDVTGNFDLAIDTGAGNAAIRNVGTTTNLRTFTLLSTGTTTLNGAIEANDGIDLNGAADVDLAGESGTFTTNNADIFLNAGSVDGAEDIILNAGNGEIILGSMGQNASISSLTVNSSGSTVLEGDITAVGAINLNQDGVTLNDDVTLESTDGSISFGALDARDKSLIIIADSDDSGTGNVNLNSVIGVDNLTVSAGEDITLSSDITGTGTLNFIANVDGGDIDNDDDLTIAAPVSGAQVMFSAIGEEADVIVNVDPNNVTGETTFDGNTTLTANITARDDLTFSGLVLLAPDTGTVTSSQGNITFNDDVSGDQDLVVNALNGSVTLNTVGATAAPTLLDINASSATLNGTAVTTAGDIELDGVNSTTLATGVVFVSNDGDIRLGSFTGDQSLELQAGAGDVTLVDGTIGQLTITDSENTFFNADFITNEDITVIATTEIQVSSSLQSGGDVSLSSDILDMDAIVRSEGSATLSGSSTFALTGEISAENGDVNIDSGLMLDGNSVISSNNGDVRFTGNVSGAEQNLTVNTISGSTNFGSTIGGGTVDGDEPDTLVITSGNVEFNGDVALATGGELRVQGIGNNTTLNADIFSASPITIDGDVIVAGGTGVSRTISTITDGDDITVNGTINAASEGNESLIIVTTGAEGNVTLENSIGSSVGLNSFAVDADGETELNGQIRVTDTIDLSMATNVQLGSDVSMAAGNSVGAGVVTLDVVDGAFDLSVVAGNTINFGGAVGGSEALDDITLTSTNGSVTIADTITTSGSANITTGGDVGEDINLAGNIVSPLVEFDAGADGLIQITATQNNSAGSTLYNGDVVIDGVVDDSIALRSLNDMIFNDELALIDIGSDGIESLSGNLEFNSAISGSDDLLLTTNVGTVKLNAVAISGSLTTVGNGTTLGEDISVAAFTTTGTGLTTLLSDISINTTTNNGNIILGTLAGDQALTLNAGTGGVSLDEGDIGSLAVLSATNVSFDGRFSTSGDIAVGNNIEGDITISNSGAVQAGGSVELTTTEAGTSILINGDGIEATNGTRVNAVDSITINGVVASTDGEVFLTSENGGITIGANLLGDDVNVTTNDADGDNNGDITVNADLDNVNGGYILNAADDLNINSSITSADGVALSSNNAAIQLGGVTLASVNDISINDQVVLDSGDSTITSSSGSVTFNGDISGGFGLTVNAVSGTTDFTTTVGALGAVNGLTATASAIELGGDVTSDAAATLNGAVNLDTSGVTLTTSDDDVTVNGAVVGNQDFAVDVGTAEVSFLSVDTNSLTVTNAGTTTLGGDITADDAVRLDSALNVVLASDIVIFGEDGTEINLSGGNISGDFDLRIDVAGTGMVTLNDAIGDTIDVNSLTVISSGQSNIAGAIITDEGLNLGTAGNVDLTTAVALTNTDSGSVDLSGGAVDGAGFQLTINANDTDVFLGPIGQDATTFGLLDVNSTGETRLEGDITTNNADILFDGVRNVRLAGNLDISTNIGGGNIDFVGDVPGDNSLSGNFDLNLNAGTGNVELGSGAELSRLDVIDSTNTTFFGTMSVNGDVVVNATSAVDGIDATITVEGPLTADTISLNATGENDVDAEATSARIAVNGGLSSRGAINLSSIVSNAVNDTGTVVIAGAVNGDGAISIAADNEITTSALIKSSGASVSVVSENGDVTTGANLVGNDVTLGSTNENVSINSPLDNNLGGFDINAPNGFADINAPVNALAHIDINALNVDNTNGEMTAGDALNLIAGDGLTVGSNLTSESSVTLTSSASPISLGADVDAGDNIVIADDVILTTQSIVTATSGNAVFNEDISGGFGLTVNAVSGTTDFTTTVGALEAVNGLTVTASAIELGGDVTSNAAVILNGAVNLDTGGVTLTTNDDDVFVNGAVVGDQDFAIDVGTGHVSLLSVDTNSLEVTNAGTTTLGGAITADDAVFLGDAVDVDLAQDILIVGDGETDIDLSGGNISGDFNLRIDAGTGMVTLNDAIGDTIDVNSLTVISSGQSNIAGAIITDEGLNLGTAGNVDLTTAVALTNTDSGSVDLSGGAVDGAGFQLTINANDTDVFLGPIGQDATTFGLLDVNSTGETRLEGDITTNNADILFDGVRNVRLAGNLDISTNIGGGNIDFVGDVPGDNSLSGNFDLNLNAGTGNVELGSGAELSRLDVIDSTNTTFFGTMSVNGDVVVNATSAVDGIDATITVEGPLTADTISLNATGENDVDAEATSARIAVNGGLSSRGAINLSSIVSDAVNDTGTVVIAGTVDGDGAISIAADNEITTSALIKSSGASVSVVSENGDVTTGANLVGNDVTLGSTNENVSINSPLDNNLGGFDISALNGFADINASVNALAHIDINALNVDNTNGEMTAGDALSLNASNGLTVGSNLTAESSVTLTSSASPINLGAEIGAGDDILITDDAILTANTTVTTTLGNVVFSDDISGGFGLTVNATSGTADFVATVGAGEALNGLVVTASTIELGGNVTSNGAMTLNGAVSLDTGGVALITTNDDLTVNGAVAGDQDFTITVGDASVSLLGMDINSIDIDNIGATTVGGDIIADDVISLDGAQTINLMRDIEIIGDGDTDIYLGSGSVFGDFDLEVDSGTGTVQLNDINVNSLKVLSSGITTLLGNIITDEGMDLDGASDVDTAAGVSLTNTESGIINLNGGNVEAGGNLTVLANNSNIRIGAVNVNSAGILQLSGTGTTEILGDINTDEGIVDLSGASRVVLGTDISINTSGNQDNDATANGTGADIIFQDNAVDILNALSSDAGEFELTLDAGTEGNISFGDVTSLSGLTIHDIEDPGEIGANDVTFNGRLEVTGPITIAARGTVTGGPTTPTVDNFILSSGRVVIRNGNDIIVAGDHFISLTATGDGVADDDGDIIIGAIISAENGDIRLTADDDIVFESDGKIISNGLVRLIANADASNDISGILELDGENDGEMPDGESEIDAGNLVMSVFGENGFVGEGVNPADADAISTNDLIEIDSATSLTVEAGGSGSVHIANLNDMVITDFDNDTVDGVNGGIRAGSGNVNLQAMGNIRIGDISTTGSVVVVATGSVNDAADANTEVDVTGGSISLTGNLGVGNVSRITSDTSVIDAQSTSGDITLLNIPNADVATTINDLQTVESGDISFTQQDVDGMISEGLTVTSVSMANGDLEITNVGDDKAGVTLGDINVDGDVSVRAENAQILDDENETTRLTGELVTLTALTGVGAPTALETAAEQLDVSVTGAGDIMIDELDAVELLEIDTSNGSISIQAGGDTLVTDVESITSNAGNDINLEITSGDAMIGRIDAKNSADVTVTVDNGSVQKIGANSLITGDDLSISITGGSIGSASDPITTQVNRYFNITSQGGDIHLTEADSVTIESVNTGSSVFINAGVINGDGVVDDTDITASSIDLTTELNIGDSDDPLNLVATSISAQTSNADGLINLSNANDQATTITLNTAGMGGDESITFAHTGRGQLTIESAITADGSLVVTADDAAIVGNFLAAGGSGNNIALVSGGDLTIDDLRASSDSITLESRGSIEEIDNDSELDLTAANVVMNSATGIGRADSLEIQSETVNAMTTGDSASIALTNRSNVPTRVNEFETQGAGADITFEQVGGGDVTFDNVNAVNANITLKTSDGGIIFVDTVTSGSDQGTIVVQSAGTIDEVNSDMNADFVSTNLELRAVEGIGVSGAIETNVENLTAITTGRLAANINLDNVSTDDLILEELTTSNGDISIAAMGNIADSAGADGDTVTSGGKLDLDVEGKIGALNNPLDIDAAVELNLTFSGSGSRTPVWAMLNGTAGGTTGGENVHFLGTGREPPGLIVWNGVAVSGANEDLQDLDRAQSFYNESRLLIKEQPVFIPAFFRHVMVSMNELWTIPSIEFLNIGGGFIFGLPKELDLPSSMNVYNIQDEPYRWYSLPMSLSDVDATYF